MLIDVHCHLEMCENPEEIVNEAERKGMIIVTDGVNAQTNQNALEFARKNKNVRACLGLYPIESLKLSDFEVEDIIKVIRENKSDVWGIGEIGLDYKESTKPEEHERQKTVFRQFVQLAIELDKTVTIHSRKAEEDCIKILEELKAKRVIMHCFSGRMGLAKRIIENGWFLSVPTSVNNSTHFQEIIKLTPIGQLLCETDSPYLHPEKEWPNSPLNVGTSYRKISELKGISQEETERQIENNFLRISN